MSSPMYARFQVAGSLAAAQKKVSGKGKAYGQIIVACGTVGHEFFVEAQDIDAGVFKLGQQITVEGEVARRGFNPELKAHEIKIDGKLYIPNQTVRQPAKGAA